MRYVFAALACFFNYAAAADDRCAAPLARVTDSGHESAPEVDDPITFYAAGKYVLKTAFYPYVATVKTGNLAVRTAIEKNRAQAMARVGRWLKNDWLNVLGFMAMTYQASRHSSTIADVEQDTAGFDEGATDNELVVLVSFHGKGTLRSEYSFAEMRRPYGGKKVRIKELIVSSMEELSEKLREIAASDGKIHKIEIHAHGLGGLVSLVKDPNPSLESRAKVWEESSVGRSSEIVNHLGLVTVVGNQYLSRNAQRLFLKGVCAPGAKLRLRTCYTGRGVEGEEFSERLGRLYFDQGGTVYSNTNLVWEEPFTNLLPSSLGVQLPHFPSWIENSIGLYSMPVRFVAPFLQRDEQIWVIPEHKATIIPIPPRKRWD